MAPPIDGNKINTGLSTQAVSRVTSKPPKKPQTILLNIISSFLYVLMDRLIYLPNSKHEVEEFIN
jgi:cytochrome c-type biogenesis protein CcmH/NrfF